MRDGTVLGVNGPVVHLGGLSGCTRFEYVEVGEDRLPAEVLSVDRDVVVAQLYEYSGGLRVGAPARASGHPLSVRLGPDLLGGVYDGLLRPLEHAPTFLPPRALGERSSQRYDFSPIARPGAAVGPGHVIGEVAAGGDITHLVLVPPGLEGTLEEVAEPGRQGLDDTVATIDGARVTLTQEWPIRTPRPYAGRHPDREPFRTGQRILDLLAPISRGSAATVIGGFGEGKTMLLEQIAKWGDADVIIYVGCGERGNEMTELIHELAELTDPRTDLPLMERTVILANTSNMPVMAREASIYTAVTVAEYYRDMGLHVVIIADSTSRWAEARRELASRIGAIPAEEGYPADLPTSLAAFYQRSGRVTSQGGRDGAVTMITSVSPPGGDTTEPVSAHTQRFVQAVWSLDRDLAYARHYPAISWARSFSRDDESAAAWHAAHHDPDWGTRRLRLRTLLAEADRISSIADLVGVTALPAEERLTLLTGRLIREGLLQQSALSENDAVCGPNKQAALASAMLAVHDTALRLAGLGVPSSLLEEFDYGPLLRAKDATGRDDSTGVEQVTSGLLRALERLAR